MDQDDLRQKIEDLKSTLTLSNHPWGAWELEFIEDMADKLNGNRISLTPKQEGKVIDLWEKL